MVAAGECDLGRWRAWVEALIGVGWGVGGVGWACLTDGRDEL